MSIVTKDVKLGGVIVASVEIPIYDTVEELLSAEDDTRVLSCFNNGNKVRIMSNERAKHQDKPLTASKKFMLGMGVLTMEELQSVAGNEDAMKELALSDDVQSRIEQVSTTEATKPADSEEDVTQDAGDVED